MTRPLPSARHLADLHGFFKTATLLRDGTANLTFSIPPDMVHELVALANNDGMALNISVWETKLPEGDDWLAQALGLDDGAVEDEPEPVNPDHIAALERATRTVKPKA